MNDYFVFELIKSLDLKEIKEFKVFLSSPFFNNKKYLRNYFIKILTYYPDFTDSELIFSKVKKKLNLKDSTLRAVNSKLSKLLMEFLTYKNFNKNTFDKTNFLFKELIYRNLLGVFKTKSNRFDKYELPNIHKDSFFFLNLFLYSSFKINHKLDSIEFLKKENVNEIVSNINLSYHYLYVFFITSTISDYINFSICYYDYGVNIDDTFLNKLISTVNTELITEFIKKDKKTYSFFSIYIRLLECFKDISNVKKYISYKNAFFDCIERLNEDERNFHLTNLINLCLLPKRTNELNLLYNEIVFGLYKIMLEKKYYLDSKNKYLSPSLFRDILIISIKLNELHWAKEFVTNYSRRVAPEQKENMLNFGFAYLYNNTHNYAKSIEYLYKIKVDRFIYKYDVRDMHLKMLYEMYEYEKVLEKIHSYKDFLRNNEFATKDRKLFRGNFIKFLENLTLYKIGNLKIDIGYLKKLILNAKHISNKKWLIEKIEESMNKKKINIKLN